MLPETRISHYYASFDQLIKVVELWLTSQKIKCRDYDEKAVSKRLVQAIVYQSVTPFINVIGFEPDEREYAKIQQKENFRVFNYALADKSSELTLYVSREPGKTSLYKPNTSLIGEFPNSERFDVVDKVCIPAERVSSLDHVLKENKISNIDFLKIDTQGSELDILRGSHYVLDQQVIGLKIEVEFIEMYCKQPLFSNVDQYMRDHKFDLIDLRRSYWQRKDNINYRGNSSLEDA